MTPAPSQQQLAIQDALRLLAIWAVREAREHQQGAKDAAQAPNGGLDFPAPRSDEWVGCQLKGRQ
jgi:hypothetical protein